LKDPLAWFDRRWLVGCAAFIALVVAFGYAGPSAGILLYRLLIDGLIAIAWVLAGMGLGWVFVRRFDVPLSLRLVTAAAIGLGAISLMALGLGMLGWLNGIVVWAVVLIGIACGAWWVVRSRNQLRVGARDPAGWSALVLVAMPFLGLSIVGAAVPPGVLWQDEPAGYDVTEYHLEAPREWFEHGRITPLRHNVFSYMPMNVEMHDLLAMHLRGGPWSGMYLAQFMHVGWTVLAVWAVWAIAASLSERPWAGPLAGVGMAVVPWVTSLAPVAYNEAGVMLFGVLAVGWVMRAKDWRGWAVAGALAGLACGVKLTAVPMVVGAVVIAKGVVDVKCQKANVKSLGVFVLLSLVIFAPWLIRNWVWTGNPVFPERMEWFGRGHFSEVQQERWRRAHSPREDQKSVVGRARAAGREIGGDWRYGFVFFPLVIASLAMLRDRRAAFLAAMLVVQLIVWMAFTHLQGRFYVLAIPVGAVAIGLARERAWAIGSTCAIAVIAIISIYVLDPTILGKHGWPRYEIVRKMGEQSVLGVEDLKGLVPFDLSNVSADRPLVLVGDAQAFWYSQIPITRIRYRTVFDVPPPGDGDWLAAWTGDENGTVVVFPSELARFGRTYFAVPVPPEAVLREWGSSPRVIAVRP
jgi:hypothetical protein